MNDRREWFPTDGGNKNAIGKIVRHEFWQCSERDREWAYALKSEAYRGVVERQFGAWDEAHQRRLFAKRWQPSITRIIVVDGLAVGLLALEDRSAELWIDEIQVARDWRGHGLGTAIIRELLEQAHADRKPLRLQVLKLNVRARELYRRLGFTVMAETPTHYQMERRPDDGLADDAVRPG